MIRILRFNIRNFIRQWANLVFTVFAIGMVVLGLMLYKSTEISKNMLEMIMIVDVYFMLMICMFSVFDSDNGTIKNVVAKGYDKVTLLFSKYIVAIIIGFLFVAVKVLTVLAYANIKSLTIPQFWPVLGHSMICLIPHVLFYVTIAVIAGKSKNAIWLCFGIEVALPMILDFLDKKLQLSVKLVEYWVTGNIIKLDAIPQIITSVVYVVLLIAIGIFAVRRKEIK